MVLNKSDGTTVSFQAQQACGTKSDKISLSSAVICFVPISGCLCWMCPAQNDLRARLILSQCEKWCHPASCCAEQTNIQSEGTIVVEHFSLKKNKKITEDKCPNSLLCFFDKCTDALLKLDFLHNVSVCRAAFSLIETCEQFLSTRSCGHSVALFNSLMLWFDHVFGFESFVKNHTRCISLFCPWWSCVSLLYLSTVQPSVLCSAGGCVVAAV